MEGLTILYEKEVIVVAKPRASTIQQRFGFMDKDLTTPKHDEIMLWLDGYVRECIYAGFRNSSWNPDYVARCCEVAGRAVNNTARGQPSLLEEWSGLGDCPPVPLPEIEVVWEYPIRDGKYIIGFVDMMVRYCSGVRLEVVDVCDDHLKRYYSEPHYRLPRWDTTFFAGKTKLFEVKAAIPSLGEVIRQVRMYQVYEKGDYTIVSPDDRYKDALKEQGIGFLKYEPGIAVMSL